MSRFTRKQISLGMCMGLGDDDFNDVLSLVNSTRALPLPDGVDRYITDWDGFLFAVREKLAKPFTFEQELDIHEMLSDWRQFSKELLDVVKEAHQSVEKCMQNVSHQREQTVAVSGRLLWGTLTLFVPPPAGVLLGAFVYAATEDNLRGSVQKFVEWGMQTPTAYGRNGQLSPRAEPNANPTSNNPGGHEKIRDLKDINQMINGVEKIFGGERGKWLKELNDVSLRKLVQVPTLGKGVAKDLESLVEQVCDQGKAFLKRALVQEWTHLINDRRKLRRIAQVATVLQVDVLTDTRRSATDASPREVITEGVCLFLNRLAYEHFESVRNARGAGRLPVLSRNVAMRNELKRRFQRLAFASYFNANREEYDPTPPAARAVGTWQRPVFGFGQAAAQPAFDQLAAMYGVVPNSFFSSSYAGTFLNSLLVSPLEEELTELTIIRKVTAQAEITNWCLVNDVDQPVPYITIDRAFRGRLRKWSACYSGDPASLAARKNEISSLLLTTNAPRLLLVG